MNQPRCTAHAAATVSALTNSRTSSIPASSRVTNLATSPNHNSPTDFAEEAFEKGEQKHIENGEDIIVENPTPLIGDGQPGKRLKDIGVVIDYIEIDWQRPSDYINTTAQSLFQL